MTQMNQNRASALVARRTPVPTPPNGERESGGDIDVPGDRRFIALLEAFRATGGAAPVEIVDRLFAQRLVGNAVSLAELLCTGLVFGFDWRARTLASWFAGPNARLGGRTPTEVLDSDLDAVIWAAHSTESADEFSLPLVRRTQQVDDRVYSDKTEEKMPLGAATNRVLKVRGRTLDHELAARPFDVSSISLPDRDARAFESVDVRGVDEDCPADTASAQQRQVCAPPRASR